MSTTNLFVELVVIGVGAALWVLLLLLSIFGYTPAMFDGDTSNVSWIPGLALIYLLGIITDRFADLLFERAWGKHYCHEVFRDAEKGKGRDGAIAGSERDILGDYHRARIRVLEGSERLSELLEYGRSRMRICRGWSFNAALALVFFQVFALSELRRNQLFDGWESRIYYTGTFSLLVLCAASWLSWKALARTGYEKTKEQALYLTQARAGSGSGQSAT